LFNVGGRKSGAARVRLREEGKDTCQDQPARRRNGLPWDFSQIEFPRPEAAETGILACLRRN
jgi:hypothetical protein